MFINFAFILFVSDPPYECCLSKKNVISIEIAVVYNTCSDPLQIAQLFLHFSIALTHLRDIKFMDPFYASLSSTRAHELSKLCINY